MMPRACCPMQDDSWYRKGLVASRKCVMTDGFLLVCNSSKANEAHAVNARVEKVPAPKWWLVVQEQHSAIHAV
jgi:hypothetical protein